MRLKFIALASASAALFVLSSVDWGYVAGSGEGIRHNSDKQLPLQESVAHSSSLVELNPSEEGAVEATKAFTSPHQAPVKASTYGGFVDPRDPATWKVISGPSEYGEFVDPRQPSSWRSVARSDYGQFADPRMPEYFGLEINGRQTEYGERADPTDEYLRIPLEGMQTEFGEDTATLMLLPVSVFTKRLRILSSSALASSASVLASF